MANVASANVAKEFRSMLIKVAQQLTEDEIIRMYFEEGFSLELPPGLQNVRIHLLHKLEAKGVFSPKNPEGFVDLLRRLPREDLVAEVNRYTQTYLRPNIFTKLRTALTKRTSVPEVRQLPSGSEDQENSLEILEDLFALAMTHVGSLMSMLDELRELIQQPIARDKLTTITPQVKEAIVALSNEEKTVIPIYESLKKLVAAEMKEKETENENVERYKKFSFSSRNSRTTLNRAKSTELLSSMVVPSLPEKEESSPRRKTLTRSLTLDPGDLNEYSESDHDYSEITSMATMGEGFGNYDKVPVKTQPTIVENSVIYDEVADFLGEDSSDKPKEITVTQDYIFMKPRSVPANNGPLSKTGGKKEAAIDWLSKLKKKTGNSPSASPPPLPEDRKSSNKTAKAKWSPYTKLMIVDKEEGAESDYAELVNRVADQSTEGKGKPQTTKKSQSEQLNSLKKS